jgi:hypothetical protein
MLVTTETHAAAVTTAPRHGLREPKLVLHLFSGRRRPGDIQHWYELLADSQALYVLSLDIALSTEHGDLTKRATIERWLALVATGRVLAIYAGPPCESWSAARYNALPDRATNTLPRPIRSDVEPWGITGITPAERRQVTAANALLEAALLFASAAARHGATMVLEHPRAPAWRTDAPTIWNLPEVRELVSHPSSTLVHLDQCTAGARSQKPTTLLAINLPELARQIRAFEGGGFCCHPGGHPTSLGLVEHSAGRSSFATAPLKEYPVRLCRAMVSSALEHWHWALSPWAPELDMPADYDAVFQPLDPYVDYQLGADHCRHRA